MKRKPQLPTLISIASAIATAAAIHWTAMACGVSGPVVFQMIAIVAAAMAIGLASGAILSSVR